MPTVLIQASNIYKTILLTKIFFFDLVLNFLIVQNRFNEVGIGSKFYLLCTELFFFPNV